MHCYYQRHGDRRLASASSCRAASSTPTAAASRSSRSVPDIRVRDDNRRLLGGRPRLHDGDGSSPADHGHARSATPGSTSAPASTSASTATGTASGAASCTSTASTSPTAPIPTTARRIHQIRDNLVRVDDPVGGGVGWGNLQSIVAGPHPELGLTEDASLPLTLLTVGRRPRRGRAPGSRRGSAVRSAAIERPRPPATRARRSSSIASSWSGCRRSATASSRPTTSRSRRRCRRRRARRACPSPRRCGTSPMPACLGAPFIAMPFVDGPIPAEFTPERSVARRTARRRGTAVRCGQSFVDTIVAIHRVDADATSGFAAGLDATSWQWWERYLGLGHRRRAAAAPWRGAGVVPRQPPRRRAAVGAAVGRRPPRQRRVRRRRSRPRAVLDWDMASVGPAEMDLGVVPRPREGQATSRARSCPGSERETRRSLGRIAALGRPLQDDVAGALLKSARLRLGLPQHAFADLIGVAQPTLSAYESGRRQPTLPTLLRLLAQAGLELRMSKWPYAMITTMSWPGGNARSAKKSTRLGAQGYRLTSGRRLNSTTTTSLAICSVLAEHEVSYVVIGGIATSTLTTATSASSGSRPPVGARCAPCNEPEHERLQDRFTGSTRHREQLEFGQLLGRFNDAVSDTERHRSGRDVPLGRRRGCIFSRRGGTRTPTDHPNSGTPRWPN